MSLNNRKASKLPTSRIQAVLNSPRKIKNAQAPSVKRPVSSTSISVTREPPGGKCIGTKNKTSTSSLKRKNNDTTKENGRNVRSIPFDSGRTTQRAPTGGTKKSINVRSRIQYPPPPPQPPSQAEILQEKNAILRDEIQQLKKERDEVTTLNIQSRNEVQEMKRSKDEYIAEIAKIGVRVDNAQARKREVEGKISDLRKKCEVLSDEKFELTSQVEIYKKEFETAQNSIQEQDEKMEYNLNFSQELTTKLQEHEYLRRDLHNLVQDLKGNIRVFCRVRPPLESESDDLADLKYPKESPVNRKISLTSTTTNYLGRKKERLKDYEFDQVFGPETTQKDIFNEVAHIVQSVVDGYNGCIFAYGQTGAGKTYTMAGPNNPTPETEGMIPRAVRLIYDLIQNLKAQCWVFKMEGQFIEIYNDTIRDLLSTNPSHSNGIKYKPEHDENTGTTKILNAKTGKFTNRILFDKNFVLVNLDSPDTLNRALKISAQNRAVAATKCNARSSRSHSVFMIRLTGINENLKEQRVGSLNLIDLAGSERLSKSESKGDQLQEAKYINSSLSHLKTVIEKLRKDSNHVNFRDSPLTWLLKNSLGGKAKVLMLVNISPLESSRSETESSLDFATCVNATH
ncbi:1249_t:CDS:2, partial [Acaulospora morrowiae]